MASLSPVIVPAKALKGGKHKVRIAVSHNGGVRYILTDIVIDSADQFHNGQVVRRPDANFLNVKLRKALSQWQEAMDNVGYTNGLTASELVAAMQDSSSMSRRTLESVYEEYCECVVQTDSTRVVYKTAFMSIAKSIRPSTIMDNINHATLLKLLRYLQSTGISNSTIRLRLTFLRALVNYAIRCGYANYRVSPFAGLRIPPLEVRQAWLSVEEVKRIRDAHLHYGKQRLKRDIFMLSYYLGGINAADLFKINFKDCGDSLCYVRQKTKRFGAKVIIPILPEAREIIDRIVDERGYVPIQDSARNGHYSMAFQDAMKSIGKAVGVENLIFYSARKSFAQHAYELGISTATIDYILGHTVRTGNGGSSLYHYVQATPKLAAEAMRKVLDNLK